MDIYTEEKRSAVMARVRSKDSGPEMVVRKIAHAMGYRFRLHRRDLPGCPDLVFPRLGKAVLVHGCFWHRHGCPRTTTPKTNIDFWLNKFSRNKERDQENLALLKQLGWDVFVIWECELRDLAETYKRLSDFLSRGDETGSR